MMPRENTIRDRALVALRSGPMTAKELAAKLEVPENSVMSAMTFMKRDLLVHAVGRSGGRTPTTYGLGAPSAASLIEAPPERDEDHFRPRRKAPDFEPFRDEYQTWFFGQPGQEAQGVAG